MTGLCCVVLQAAPAGAAAVPQRSATVAVVITTEIGEIEVAVDTTRAPLTAANFLAYVDAGLYQDGAFYRTVTADNQPDDSVRIAVIQGGMNRERRGEAFAPIRLESTAESGISHRDGTISMARAGPATATSEFFVCIGDQPELDRGGRRNPDGLGFAAFGRVVAGRDVVLAIQRSNAAGQTLRPPIRILSVRRR